VSRNPILSDKLQLVETRDKLKFIGQWLVATNPATSGLTALVSAADSAAITIAPRIVIITTTIAVTPNDIVDAGAARSAAINAPVAGIMAIDELATLFVVVSGVIPITTGCVSPNAGRAIAVKTI